MITAAQLSQWQREVGINRGDDAARLLECIAEIRALRAAWKTWNYGAFDSSSDLEAARKLLDGD